MYLYITDITNQYMITFNASTNKVRELAIMNVQFLCFSLGRHKHDFIVGVRDIIIQI